MIQAFVALLFVLWSAALVGYGSLLERIVPQSLRNGLAVPVYGMLGLFVIALAGIAFNFFIPLGQVFSLIALLVGLALFAVRFRGLFASLSRTDLLVLVVVLLYCSVFPLLRVTLYDTGFYHLPAIKWLKESRAVFGLANLNSRIGFDSSLFIVDAVTQPFRLITKLPFFIANSLLLFLFGSAVFLELKRLHSEPIKLSSLFLALCFLPWYVKLRTHISAPSPDLPVMLITLFAFFLLLRAAERREESIGTLLISFLLSAFLVTVKISSAPLAAGLFIVIAYAAARGKLETAAHAAAGGRLERASLPVMSAAAILSAALVVLWMCRNLVLTGCLVYPIRIGYFPGLKWAVTEWQLVDELGVIRGWARRSMAAWQEVMSSWSWFHPWLRRFAANELLLAGAALLGVLATVACLLERKRLFLSWALVAALVISGLGTAYWFVSAPDPRFGYGFLFSLPLLLLAFGLSNVAAAGHASGLSAIAEEAPHWRRLLLIISGVSILAGVLLVSKVLNAQIVNLLVKVVKLYVPRGTLSKTLVRGGFILAAAGTLLIAMLLLYGKAAVRKRPWVLAPVALGCLVMFNSEARLPGGPRPRIPTVPLVSVALPNGVVVYYPKRGQQAWDAPLPSAIGFVEGLNAETDNKGRIRIFWIQKGPVSKDGADISNAPGAPAN